VHRPEDDEQAGTRSFTTTITLLARVLSLTPRYSSHVMAMTISAAGMLSRIGMPQSRGAVCRRAWISGLELRSAVR
jgi:hypothetical protein